MVCAHGKFNISSLKFCFRTLEHIVLVHYRETQEVSLNTLLQLSTSIPALVSKSVRSMHFPQEVVNKQTSTRIMLKWM